MRTLVTVLAFSLLPATAIADEAHHDRHDRCRDVRGDMVEDQSTTGCKPGEPSCFLGEIDGRGLRATTHFRGDSSATGPSTSPGWVSYSGLFEYTNERGTLLMRETGVVNTTTGNLQSGAVTAMQLVVSGTGIYAGATGYLFVSGFNRSGHVETEVFGQICRP